MNQYYVIIGFCICVYICLYQSWVLSPIHADLSQPPVYSSPVLWCCKKQRAPTLHCRRHWKYGGALSVIRVRPDKYLSLRQPHKSQKNIGHTPSSLSLTREKPQAGLSLPITPSWAGLGEGLLQFIGHGFLSCFNMALLDFEPAWDIRTSNQFLEFS